MEGCQALLDGVVVACVYQSIPLLWRGVKLCLTGWYSPSMEGCQALLDGVVASCVYQSIPLLRRGIDQCRDDAFDGAGRLSL